MMERGRKRRVYVGGEETDGDQQAAAQQRPAKKDKKADKAEEKTVEAPAEKTEDSESK